MDEHTSHEQAYKNGYDKGYEDGKRDAVKHARWKLAGISAGKNIYRCTHCKTLTYGQGNFCKECGAMMDEKEEQHGTKQLPPDQRDGSGGQS